MQSGAIQLLKNHFDALSQLTPDQSRGKETRQEIWKAAPGQLNHETRGRTRK